MTPTEQKIYRELQDQIKALENKKTEPKDNIVVIKGNKYGKWLYSVLFNFFNKIAENYEQKKLKYENKEFKLKEFSFESPRLILVTFTELLSGQEYEITLHHQTAYKEYYKEYQQTKQIPKMIKVDCLIKNNYKTAVKI